MLIAPIFSTYHWLTLSDEGEVTPSGTDVGDYDRYNLLLGVMVVAVLFILLTVIKRQSRPPSITPRRGTASMITPATDHHQIYENLSPNESGLYENIAARRNTSADVVGHYAPTSYYENLPDTGSSSMSICCSCCRSPPEEHYADVT